QAAGIIPPPATESLLFLLLGHLFDGHRHRRGRGHGRAALNLNLDHAALRRQHLHVARLNRQNLDAARLDLDRAQRLRADAAAPAPTCTFSARVTATMILPLASAFSSITRGAAPVGASGAGVGTGAPIASESVRAVNIC